MKTVFGLALAASVVNGAADVLNNVQCRVWIPDWPMHTCMPPHGPYTINKDDVTKCGTADKPCPTDGGECGKCYKITYNRSPFESVVCKGGKCKGYKKSIIVKGREKGPDAKSFTVSQAAWRELCPFICRGTAECVDDPDQCTHGNDDDKNIMSYQGDLLPFPSSCDAGTKQMNVEEIECGKDAGVDPIEEDEGASIQPIDEGASIQPAKEPRAAAGVNPDVMMTMQCNVMYPGSRYTCSKELDFEASNPFIDNCGESASNPCFASGKPEECGNCYLLKFHSRGNPGGPGKDCLAGGCEPFSGHAYVKVVDSSSRADVDFGVAQGAIQHLCPHLCTGLEGNCVSDPTQCLQPIPAMDAGSYRFPSGCHRQNYEVTRTPVDCEFSTQPIKWQPKM